jgi:hypothetical protein
MSDPVHDGGPPGAKDAEAAEKPAGTLAPPRRPTRRLTDILTGVLLCIALGVALFTATPALLQAAGLAGHSEEGTSHPARRSTLLHPAGDAPSHPLFGPDDQDDDARIAEPEREYPSGPWRERRPSEERRRDRDSSQGRRDRAPEPALEEPRLDDAERLHGGSGEARTQVGVAVRPIMLLEKPGDEGGRTLGEIRPGELLMVLKEAGDFALVAHNGDDGVQVGWAKKSEIAVR